MTLVELIVVLALLAVLYSVVSVSVPIGSPDPGGMAKTLLDARRSAIRDRRVVSRSWQHEGRRVQVTAFPGGLVLADTGQGTFLATDEAERATR